MLQNSENLEVFWEPKVASLNYLFCLTQFKKDVQKKDI